MNEDLLDDEKDNRIIPIEPLNTKKPLSDAKLRQLEKARKKKNVKVKKSRVKKGKVIEKYDKLLSRLVKDNPDIEVAELKTLFEEALKGDLQMDTPASGQIMVDDSGKNEDDAVDKTQNLKHTEEQIELVRQTDDSIPFENLFSVSVNREQGFYFE